MRSIKLTLSFFFLLSGTIVFAAPAPPAAGGPSCWPPPCVPIDGGLSFLIAAGAVYGAKKLYDTRSKPEDPA